jgi:hypothetical protein
VVADYSYKDGIDLNDMRLRLKNDGIVLVRNLLSLDEIARLRQIVRDHLIAHGQGFGLGRTQPNAAARVQSLDTIYAHDRITKLFLGLCGHGNTVFTGHSDIHLNMLSGWHKDSGEAFGGYFKGDYFGAENCNVYKIAIYLQDHLKQDGLTVRPGSHRSASVASGDLPTHLATRAGDAVLFDVRLSHIGQIPDPVEKTLIGLNQLLNRGDRKRPDNEFVVALKNIYWRIRNRHDKMSIFFTFGVNNDYTQQFARSNMARQNTQAGLSSEEIRPALVKRLSACGIISFSSQQQLEKTA